MNLTLPGGLFSNINLQNLIKSSLIPELMTFKTRALAKSKKKIIEKLKRPSLIV